MNPRPGGARNYLRIRVSRCRSSVVGETIATSGAPGPAVCGFHGTGLPVGVTAEA